MYFKFKRMVDVMMASVLLLMLLPVLSVIAILLYTFNSRQVFFIQKRVGKNETVFNIYKFSTMTDAKDTEGELLPDAQRLTKLGFFLRKTSLDEIPQLINIIKGDMSFIGPRPLLPEYLPLYNEEQRQRHLVYPGLTGLAQIAGRNSLSWEDKFYYDIQYVKCISAKTDMFIFWKTIGVVLKRSNIDSNVADKFKGTDK